MITYTGDVVAKIDEIVEKAKKLVQEINVIDYDKVA